VIRGGCAVRMESTFEQFLEDLRQFESRFAYSKLVLIYSIFGNPIWRHANHKSIEKHAYLSFDVYYHA